MSALIQYANSAAEPWAAWMVAASLDAAGLLFLVGLLWLAIGRRAAPQVGYCLFLLVPLKLLAPLGVTLPATIAQWTPAALVSSWFAASSAADVTTRHPGLASPMAAARTNVPAPVEPAAQSPRAAAVLPLSSPEKNVAVAQPAAESPRLSASAALMVFWLAGVLLLAGRMALVQWRFRKQLADLSPLDESRLAVDLGELRRRTGITQPIRILESGSISSPAVWGIVQPTIILPRGLAAALSAGQLRWVLLHELAHIRRRDLLVVVLQRCAALLHFFNPAVWIANRMAHRLREYACDDLACVQSDAPAVESGQAFLQVLRHASGRRGLAGALGVFGLDSRSSCALRVRRLLDAERPIRTGLGMGKLCGIILLAVVTLPHLRAAGDEADPPAAPNQAEEEKAGPADELAADQGAFELRVVGPDGKPVPEAAVEIRTKPMPTAEQIEQGTFVKKGSYGAFATTDGEGWLRVAMPRTPGSFDVNITTPGYGPYWASWSSHNHPQPIPARFTAELEAGWSVGGIILDDQGTPVTGASVHPSIEYKKRPGDLSQLSTGARLTTDAAGKWRFDSVPASMQKVFVSINHAGFKPQRQSLSRREFGLERGQEPVGKLALDRGLTVTGTITDEAGKPIAGALVRTKFHNELREAKAGEDGVYRLGGCEPRMARIVVSAKGRALDMQEVRVDEGMEPVDFQMKPGGTIRVRVLNEQGQPVPKARVFLQKWRGRVDYFEFNHINQYADAQGVWEWHEAPLDEFRADISPPDGMPLDEQPLLARDEEYVFRVPPPLVVSGNVVDAQTRQPVKEFQVVPGIRFNSSQMSWQVKERFTATDGKYRVRRTSGYFAHLIRIEAEGYQAAVSRDIKSNEGSVAIDFELLKGTNVAATVLTPAGRPAAGARVALGVGGSQISVKNGEIHAGQTYSARQDTDDAGQFRFPPQSAPFQLVITHPAGFAHVHSTPDSPPETIKLEAWARVEGTFRVGKEALPNVPITLNSAGLHSHGKDVPHIFTDYETTTDKDGRFTFERVFPGGPRVGRRILLMVDEGAMDITSSCMTPLVLISGETTRIDLGGTGRPVIGKLQPAAGFKGQVKWNFALVEVSPHLPPPPMPKGPPPLPADVGADAAKRAAWLLNWEQTTGEGQVWRAWRIYVDAQQQLRDASPDFRASVNRDGTFRIDDMPVGSYLLSVDFSRDAAGNLRDYRFSVPPIEGRSAEPLDLGVLGLQ